ncbi:glycosyltransferase family 4 protein [Campylobacter estrildidarum]|uniref:Glycosyltransferase family 4 protein n=1 Tax=Campylobacter estrildidarum TaxID=2510189 RepID=A0A4U7BN40_9BACT|nr:glycosyltransferase family 4 protein [Campylobacter estrildidarum]TKX32071.1 glycosyltransferase family 4 protein [Campylobacter estrildidarum]
MNILLLIGDITIGGGAERVVVNLANAFLEYGYKVKILSFYKANENIAYELDKNIKVDFLNLKSQKQMKKNLFYKVFYKYHESYLLKRKYKDIDVMIYNNCPHFPLFKNKNTKYIHFVHRHFKKYRNKNNYFDTLVVLSNKQIHLWKQHHKNVLTIPNFLPFISSKNSNLSQKNVLSVGRFTCNDEKGFLRLIKIWEIVQKNNTYKDWTLTLIGDGGLKEKIKTLVKEKNLQNSIILKPFTKEIEKEYLKASIYAMASHWEGFGMVLIESASYQIPSIAFDINTGPSDIIDNEKSGFLIKDGDLNEFANKLCLLMDDENLRKEFGKNAKAKVEENFNKEKVMQQWNKILNS